MTAFFCAGRCSMKRDFGCLDVQTTSRPQKRSSSAQVSAFNIGNARTGQLGASNCWSKARVQSLKSNMRTRSASARQNVWLRIYRFSRVREPGAYRSTKKKKKQKKNKNSD